MSDAPESRIVARLSQAGEGGVAMGQLVDELTAEGYADATVERGVFRLLSEGRIGIAGFLARRVRRPDGRGRRSIHHTYEPMLAVLPQSDVAVEG